MIRTVYGIIGIPHTTYQTLEGLLRARACQDRWEEQNVVYVCREEEDNDIYDGGNEA